MQVARLCPVLGTVAVVLAGCGSQADPAAAPTLSATTTTSAVAPSPSETPVETPTETPGKDPSDSGQVRALTLDQLRKLVLGAVRAERSVHMAVGNLNPPPSTEVDQDYSTPDGDLRVVVNLEPGSILLDARRADGEVYVSFEGKPFKHVPAQEMSKAEETPLIAQFRTDVTKDLAAIFAATKSADFAGADPSVGAGVTCYRLEVETAEWFAAQGGGRVLGVPQHAGLPRKMKGRLCIANTGLPVRIEVRYSKPLGGIAGTGTVRVDYSRWSEPFEVERP